MSRCFPFPPPGYEKKPKIDETDILTKEKQKEKKHTKDKKEKRKREGKEKKDKERSEKNKDKKDPKEKLKDSKDRDKNRDKNDISDENKIKVQPIYRNGESNLGANNLHVSGTKDSKFLLELDRRIKDEDKATGSRMAQKITVRDQRGSELSDRAVESNPFGWVGDEKINYRREADERVNGQSTKVEAGSEKSIAHMHSRTGDRRVEGMDRAMEKNNVQSQMEEKEKFKLTENSSKEDKHKDKDREKKSKSKDKDGDKAKRKQEKAKRKEERAKRKEEKAKKREEKAKKKEERARKKEEKVAGKINELNTEQVKFEESIRDKGPCSDKLSQILTKSSKDYVGEKSSGKRKDVEINGFLHVHEIRPSKLPRPISSNAVVENGRKTEACQSAIKFQPNQQNIDTIADKKEQRANGFTEAQLPIVCSTKPPPATARADVGSSRSVKPSHPDLKYLNQILSLPQIEESPEFDDQEWLLGANNLQSKTPMVGATGDDRTVDVWAEAVRIESVDLTALPYVLPY